MKMPILSVKDRLIGFGTTFTSVNLDVAIRGFNNSVINAYQNDLDDTSPEDLSLFHVGDFDTQSGCIDSFEPVCLSRGHELITSLSVKE